MSLFCRRRERPTSVSLSSFPGAAVFVGCLEQQWGCSGRQEGKASPVGSGAGSLGCLHLFGLLRRKQSPLSGGCFVRCSSDVNSARIRCADGSKQPERTQLPCTVPAEIRAVDKSRRLNLNELRSLGRSAQGGKNKQCRQKIGK